MKSLIVPFFIAHQGCTHRCVFCNQLRISGGSEKVPAPDELLATIAVYRDHARGRIPEVAFFGGSFTALSRSLQEQLLLPLQPLLEAGELSSVRVSTRPDAIDCATAEFLLRRGVGTVELGVQSLDDGVLTRAGRGHTARDAESACRILLEAGLQVGVQLMPGLPGDTAESALATLEKSLALKPDFLRIYPTLVIAGTELDTMFRRGDYVPMELSAAVTLCKVMLHRALRACVPVVRIGLQATDELQYGGTIVAGPWHPAFRQLVEGELFYDLMLALSGDIPTPRPVSIFCAPTRLSDVAGQRRANLLRLHRERGVEVAALIADPRLSSLEVRLESKHVERIGHMLHDLNYGGEVATHVC